MGHGHNTHHNFGPWGKPVSQSAVDGELQIQKRRYLVPGQYAADEEDNLCGSQYTLPISAV